MIQLHLSVTHKVTFAVDALTPLVRQCSPPAGTFVFALLFRVTLTQWLCSGTTNSFVR